MSDTVDTKQEDIGALVRRLERDYISGQTTSSKYVTTSLSDDVNQVYAYLESKHISGPTDSMGRDKPFFNIVLAARNIWFRATDLDRKDIRIKSTKSADVLTAFVATAWLQDWMRKENFGAFLNDWGLNMAGFNETVLKFVPQNGRLVPTVVAWNRIMCDSVNFKDNPKIEKLELTEAQLRKNKNYDKGTVDALCNSLRVRETLEKQRKDNKSTYIKLYEVHGEFSQWVYKKSKKQEPVEEDKDIYFQQMHVISFVKGEKKGGYDDFTLYSGKEKDPYMLTALLPEVDGSIALRGAVKCLFDAQWMVNHSVKAIKDQLDLASKLIFQTSDGTFVGQNALTAIETGDILIHKINEPLTQVANASHDITSLDSMKNIWKSLGNEIVGISESMLGINPPSGTAWRSTQTLLNEAHSLFEIMTENKGLYIEQMLREFIIPFLKTKLGTSKEIATTLDSHGISQIDSIYITNEAIKSSNSAHIDSILNTKPGEVTTMGGAPITPQSFQSHVQSQVQGAQNKMSASGSQRFLKPSDIGDTQWKVIFKDLEWEIECDITGEDTPDKDDLATLNTVLQTIATNPRVLMDPNAKMVFNKILQVAGGISPLQLVDAQPYVIPPTKKLTETMDYKDTPEDIKRQIEEQAGFQPSQQPTPATAPPSTVGNLPVNK